MKQKGENHFARKRLRRCEELERIEIENAAIARGVYKELEVVLQGMLSDEFVPRSLDNWSTRLILDEMPVVLNLIKMKVEEIKNSKPVERKVDEVDSFDIGNLSHLSDILAPVILATANHDGTITFGPEGENCLESFHGWPAKVTVVDGLNDSMPPSPQLNFDGYHGWTSADDTLPLAPELVEQVDNADEMDCCSNDDFMPDNGIAGPLRKKKQVDNADEMDCYSDDDFMPDNGVAGPIRMKKGKKVFHGLTHELKQHLKEMVDKKIFDVVNQIASKDANLTLYGLISEICDYGAEAKDLANIKLTHCPRSPKEAICPDEKKIVFDLVKDLWRQVGETKYKGKIGELNLIRDVKQYMNDKLKNVANAVKLAEEKLRLNARGGASVGKSAKVKKVDGPLKARNGKNCVAFSVVKGSKCVKPSKSKVLMDDTENQDVGDVHRKK